MKFQKGNTSKANSAKRKKVQFFQIKTFISTFIKKFKIKYACFSKISNDTKQFCQKLFLQTLP